RKSGLGGCWQLRLEMSTDRARRVGLEGRDSKKGNPNENYGRELMELFSLGVGNYTEKDIREAARAFTGWEVHDGEPKFNARQHDDGTKTVLGKTGKLKPDDVVAVSLEQKECPFLLAHKLVRVPVSESIEPT